jgi:hypothetical protein
MSETTDAEKTVLPGPDGIFVRHNGIGTNECCLKNTLPAFATRGRRAWRTSQAHGKQEKAGTTDFFASPGRYLVLSMLAFGESSAMQLASDTQFGGTHMLAMGHDLRI